MRLLLVLMCLLPTFVALPCLATTFRVPAEHSTIQAGIDACTVGDTVLVAEGLYKGAGNTNLLFKGIDILLLSESGAEKTIIDGQDESHGIRLNSGETCMSVISGFTIRNCRPYNSPQGGGLTCNNASVTLVDMIFRDNYEYTGGGGAAIAFGSMKLKNVAFIDNVGVITGGGFYAIYSNVEMEDVYFSGNLSNRGGGVSCKYDSKLWMRNVIFEENGGTQDGGGMYLRGNVTVDILDVEFRDNIATDGKGGGLFMQASISGSISQCKFTRNRAYYGYGGGIFCMDDANPILSNLTVEDNYSRFSGSAIGIMQTSGIIIRNSTIAENLSSADDTGSVYVYTSTVEIVNCIIAAATDGGGIHTQPFADLTLQCCNVYGNHDGNYIGELDDQTGINGNISEDPQFCGIPGSENYFLQSDSPCAPANNDCGTLMGAYDIGCDTISTLSTSFSSIKSLY